MAEEAQEWEVENAGQPLVTEWETAFEDSVAETWGVQVPATQTLTWDTAAD